MTRPLPRPLPLGALLLATATSASAHGAWLAESHGNLAVIYGHGASDEAYDPAKVTSLQGCDAQGACADLPMLALDTHVELAKPEGVTTIVATFDNGYWTEDAQGEWHNLPRTEVEGAASAGRYLKYTTFVMEDLDGEARPAGLALEIVPLANPLDLAAGDELPVRVLLEGAPLAGAEVTADYVNDAEAAPVVADAEGVARVPLRNNGLNVLAVSHTGPAEDPALADETGHTATLAFTLHSHED